MYVEGIPPLLHAIVDRDQVVQQIFTAHLGIVVLVHLKKGHLDVSLFYPVVAAAALVHLSSTNI